MIIMVVAAIIYTGVKASTQLADSDFDFRKVRWRWWMLSVLAYVGAMTLSCLFWHRVLWSLGQQANYQKTFLAFFSSQLGKYVPGKAMVVVIRTDIIRSDKASVVPAAASVFVETLTWLFVGAAIGSLVLVLKFREQTWLLIAAVALTMVTGSLTAPPIFQAIAKRLNVAQGRQSDQILAGLNWPTMSFGWLVMSLGWCLNGLSLWLVLYGIVGDQISWSDYPLTLACVTLATVAGFVSLLPGGLGVRELVMIPLLGARFGSVTAVVAAVAIRLVWLAAELAMSAIMFVLTRRRSAGESRE